MPLLEKTVKKKSTKKHLNIVNPKKPVNLPINLKLVMEDLTKYQIKLEEMQVLTNTIY